MTITEQPQFVYLENEGPQTVSYRYQFTRYTIEPDGKRHIVPWGHFTLLCGNPFLRNDDQNQEREFEYQRVRTRYGRTNRPEDWPKIRAYDEDGDELYGVMHDRLGEKAPRASAFDPTDPAAMFAQLQSMQKSMERMQQRYEAALATAQAGEIPTDTSTTLPEPSTQDPSTPPAASAPAPSGIVDLAENASEPGPPPTIPEDKPSTPRTGPTAAERAKSKARAARSS